MTPTRGVPVADDARAPRFEIARSILRRAVDERACPAAVIEVGTAAGPVWREAFGRLTYEPDAPAASSDTIFDLASLTKVIATASLAMRAVESRTLGLDDPVARWLPGWRGADREEARLRDLLGHSAGLTGYLPFFTDPYMRGRGEYERAICATPLEYRPRTRSVYSDLGFILLGFVLEDVRGASLPAQFAAIADLVAPEPLTFRPPDTWRPDIAPTEVDPWRGRLLVGEVHDENAWALGGAAGHAGLFGSAGAVGRFARLVLDSIGADTALARADTLAEFRRRSLVPDSSRALGWDTMIPTSSCGRRMSTSAIGHTGFTGTSLWIDPEADAYVVLLSNRVHPTRANEAFRAVRPLVHDAVMAALAGG
jgi:CubicO group peptidase (beta-lactamase class C family)